MQENQLQSIDTNMRNFAEAGAVGRLWAEWDGKVSDKEHPSEVSGAAKQASESAQFSRLVP